MRKFIFPLCFLLVLHLSAQSDVAFSIKRKAETLAQVHKVVYRQTQEVKGKDNQTMRGGDLYLLRTKDTIYWYSNVLQGYFYEPVTGKYPQDSFKYVGWQLIKKQNDVISMTYVKKPDSAGVNYVICSISNNTFYNGRTPDMFEDSYYTWGSYDSAKFISNTTYRVADSLLQCYKIQFITSVGYKKRIYEFTTMLMECSTLIPVLVEKIYTGNIPRGEKDILSFPFENESLRRLPLPPKFSRLKYTCRVVSWE